MGVGMCDMRIREWCDDGGVFMAEARLDGRRLRGRVRAVDGGWLAMVPAAGLRARVPDMESGLRLVERWLHWRLRAESDGVPTRAMRRRLDRVLGYAPGWRMLGVRNSDRGVWIRLMGPKGMVKWMLMRGERVIGVNDVLTDHWSAKRIALLLDGDA